jgi:hypothetical protein
MRVTETGCINLSKILKRNGFLPEVSMKHFCRVRRSPMTTFEDRLFACIHNLPVADEPVAHLESGPSEPGAFQKFHEQVVLDHAMGKSSSPAAADVPALEKLLAPRDSRDFSEPMPRSGDGLAKRFTATIGAMRATRK